MYVFTINHISFAVRYPYNAISVNENKSLWVDHHLIDWKPVINHYIFFALSKNFVELATSDDSRWIEVNSFAYLHVKCSADFLLGHLVSKKCARDGGGQRFWNFFDESNSF